MLVQNGIEHYASSVRLFPLLNQPLRAILRKCVLTLMSPKGRKVAKMTDNFDEEQFSFWDPYESEARLNDANAQAEKLKSMTATSLAKLAHVEDEIELLEQKIDRLAKDVTDAVQRFEAQA